MKFSTINTTTEYDKTRFDYGTQYSRIQISDKQHMATVEIEINPAGELKRVSGRVVARDAQPGEFIDIHPVNYQWTLGANVTELGVNWGAWGTQSVEDATRFRNLLEAAMETVKVLTGRYITKDDEQCQEDAAIARAEAQGQQ